MCGLIALLLVTLAACSSPPPYPEAKYVVAVGDPEEGRAVVTLIYDHLMAGGLEGNLSSTTITDPDGSVHVASTGARFWRHDLRLRIAVDNRSDPEAGRFNAAAPSVEIKFSQALPSGFNARGMAIIEGVLAELEPRYGAAITTVRAPVAGSEFLDRRLRTEAYARSLAGWFFHEVIFTLIGGGLLILALWFSGIRRNIRRPLYVVIATLAITPQMVRATLGIPLMLPNGMLLAIDPGHTLGSYVDRPLFTVVPLLIALFINILIARRLL